MKFKTWIGVFVAVLSAFETITFAYQKVDLPGIKPKSKNEKPVQVEFITPEELKEKIAKSAACARKLDSMCLGSSAFALGRSRSRG